jgi:hypothetical protein
MSYTRIVALRREIKELQQHLRGLMRLLDDGPRAAHVPQIKEVARRIGECVARLEGIERG